MPLEVKVIVPSRSSATPIIRESSSSSRPVVTSGGASASAVVGSQSSSSASQQISSRVEPGLPLYSVQFNSGAYFAGSNSLLFSPLTKTLQVSGGSVLVGSGCLKIDTNAANSNLFQVKHNSANLINVDSSSKKIYISTDTNAGEYYVGIGTNNPTEKLHIVGNQKLEGQLSVGGHITPLASGIYDLGSQAKPFKDIYGNGYHLSGIPYKHLENSIRFISASVPSGESQVVVTYDDLFYVPKVVCSLIVPENQNSLLIALEKVTSTSFEVEFSAKTPTTGYSLNCYLSALE